MPLADLQERFVNAALDPAIPPPPEAVHPDGRPAGRRFNVYRNNIVVGLVNALRAAYPAVERIVGAEFFAAMARAYVPEHLPRRPAMIDYGDDFPDFLQTFPPAHKHPYLADVAKLEQARLVAYHAADAQPLSPAELSALPPGTLGQTHPHPHPAAGVVRSAFPVVTIWMMNAGLREPARVDFSESEDALVTRPHLEVEVRLLRPGAAAFVLALANGAELSEAAAAGSADAADFDLAATLADCLSGGAFAALGGGGET